jgi:hypothetical protein
MADKIQVVVDARAFNRALRVLNRELQRETRRRMAAISRKVRDEGRANWPDGPAKGGHSRTVIGSGTDGLIPYVRFQRQNPRYLYAPWIEWGGRRHRRYRSWIAVDRQERPQVRPGRFFYPAVINARKTAPDEVFAALLDAKRRAGLR